MKYFNLAFITLLLAFSSSAQVINAKYDKALADSLGSDDYGMKSYVLVILKTGSNNPQDKQVRDSLFKGHMANIQRLAKEGKLVVAGPLQNNEQQYRGIFIFNAKTIEEAKSLVETDPAVHAGIFNAEYFRWYGSAALPMYLPFHEKLEKKKF